MTDTVETIIRQHINANDVALFMKGTPEFPQCGFSALVVHILQSLHVPFQAINVLEDPEIREGIKRFSDWPTIPQLYIKQVFVGGSDIVKELYQEGELQKMLEGLAQ